MASILNVSTCFLIHYFLNTQYSFVDWGRTGIVISICQVEKLRSRMVNLVTQAYKAN